MNETRLSDRVPPECNRTASDEDGSHCAPFWDTIMCWPRTKSGQLAVQPCFAELQGIKYDSSGKSELDDPSSGGSFHLNGFFVVLALALKIDQFC